VVSVDVEPPATVGAAAEALNTVLPDDVAFVAVEEAAPDFHARFSARSRSYRYRICDGARGRRSSAPVAFHPRPLDLQKLNTSPRCSSVSTIPRVHPDRHAARCLRPRRRGRALARPGRHDRARDHGRLVPAPHVRTLVGTMLERDPDEFPGSSPGARSRRLDRSAWGSTSRGGY